MTEEAARDAFCAGRVARIATLNPDGTPHQVPVTFAGCGDPVGALVFAVDHKPKSGKPLRRVENLRVRPAVCLLVDEWDEDWSRLWWARADGTAVVLEDDEERRTIGLAALAARYPQYRELPPAGPMVWIEVAGWAGWSGSG